MKVTVLGAGGGLGAAVAGELTGRGHRVTAVSRRGDVGPGGARRVAADLADREATAAAARDADVVVMAAQPPYDAWPDLLPPMVDNAVAAARRAEAKLVFVDNLYMYGPVSGPISEATPERPNNPKMALRRDLGQRLLAAHRDEGLSVAIGRLSDYFGPRGTNSLVHNLVVAPAVAGRRIQLFIDPDQPHTFAYLPDAARAFAELVEHPEADGRAWILPSGPPLTQRQLADVVRSLVGHPVKVGTLRPWMIRSAAMFNADARASRHVIHQFDRPFVVDASGFDATFGPFATTPHGAALEATVRWAEAEASQRSPAAAGRS